jgi:flavin reductase (DIM6/NTAB) family NADH-FMN oxidoreductase RutF
MTDSTNSPDPLAQALGRVPSGVFILTSRQGEQTTGMIASWVQQAGFEPPMITVAIQRDRYLSTWLLDSRRFVLNQLAVGQKPLLSHFIRGFPPGVEAFEGLAVRPDPWGVPILSDALAYLCCSTLGDLLGGDHRIILGRVEGGEVVHPEAEPMVHLRGHGLHY